MSTRISRSVGTGGINLKNDVLVVQQLINANIGKIVPLRPLSEDKRIGPATIGAIREFQSRVVRLRTPDGRVDPNGKTHKALLTGIPKKAAVVSTGKYFSHAGAGAVTLNYGSKARKMTATAETLLKSILASCSIKSARITSTRRTYHDQARITITQTWPRSQSTVKTWYGATVYEKCKVYQKTKDIQGFADWWEAYDKKRGRVSSRHLSNQALDVVPATDRLKFVAKVKELVPVSGSGVRKIIPKGVLGEPVDHVEFTFKVCPV